MEMFTFDANIPIAFRNSGHFDILIALFSDFDKYKIIMSKENFNECKDFNLRKELKNLTCFTTEDNVDKEIVKQIKDVCEKKLRKKLHQKKDSDYHVIALAIQRKVNYLVTNDRDLFHTFEKYKRFFPTNSTLQRIQPLTMATFLRYLAKLNKDVFTPSITANINFDVYEKEEVPCFCIQVKDMGMKDTEVQSLFRFYADNVLEAIPKNDNI